VWLFGATTLSKERGAKDARVLRVLGAATSKHTALVLLATPLKALAAFGFGPAASNHRRQVQRRDELGAQALREQRKGFALLPQRWLVERKLTWLNRNRRLSKNFEARIESGMPGAISPASSCCRADSL
jgi:hypothetical protein